MNLIIGYAGVSVQNYCCGPTSNKSNKMLTPTNAVNLVVDLKANKNSDVTW